MEAVIIFLALITDSGIALVEIVGSLAVWWWHPSDADSPKPTEPRAKKKGG